MSNNLRPGLEEMPEDQCWRLLARKRVGRLAVVIDTKADIFPVNYRLNGESIVIRTGQGVKLAAATLGPSVAFEVDSLDEANHTGWSIVVQGSATEIDSLEDLLEVDRLAIEPWARGRKAHYLRIVPERITGRQIVGAANPQYLAPGRDDWFQ